MIPLSRATASGDLEEVAFQPGDMIQVIREDNILKMSVKRDDILLFSGKNRLTCLMARMDPAMTATHAWTLIELVLTANWIITTVLDSSDDMVTAKILRIATCQEEADPRLPNCSAGGDGYGRD